MINNKIPAVTIGIPFYNAEKTLLDTVRSVFAQTHQDWELILLDDGSTDRSLELAKSIRDPRVRVYSDGMNIRLAGRLNQITQLAKHDFIARMDADDLMSPERLRIQLNIIKDKPEIDLISCGLYSVKNDLTVVGIRGSECDNYTFQDLLKKNKIFIHAALLARKSWYQRNTYNQDLPPIEDTELWLRAAKSGDFKALSISDPLYIYREEGNITAKKLLSSYRLERKYISQMIENRNQRLQYIIQSILKTTITHSLNTFGKLSLLQQRRNITGIDRESELSFQIIIKKILSTRIPGLD